MDKFLTRATPVKINSGYIERKYRFLVSRTDAYHICVIMEGGMEDRGEKGLEKG